MPKSGTTLVMEYQNDLIRCLSSRNGLEAAQTLGYLPKIECKTARALRKLSIQNGDFLVKTHSKPSFWIRELVAKDEAKVTFCFRDPRDTMLSVIDHGKRTREGLDSSGAFAEIITLRDAISFAKASIRLYYAWRKYGQALFIQYEKLMSNKMQYLEKMATYFGYPYEEQTLDDIFQKHERLKERAWNFNKGTVNRWQTEMTPEERALCNKLFNKDLVAMGYKIL
ncbi:MAG: sulfotransferase domain-containing protein [Cyanophyceae cyanobacterium]